MTLDSFLQDALKIFDSQIKHKEGKVFEASGQINCLFYIKERKSKNQNWGLTKNVIDRLLEQGKPWFVLLLSSPPYSNYLLTVDHINYFIKNKWTLREDGDYKTAPTFPDENQFTSLLQLKNKLLIISIK